MAAHKKQDRRLVRQVVSSKRAPTGWTPMDIMEIDCKFMEVRKYSSDYFEVDTKFRRPNLQLISAYCLQNPFLWGQYLLRREQMIQQLTKFGLTVKENNLFTSTDMEKFEKIGRCNFDTRMYPNSRGGVVFHRDAAAAHKDTKTNTNPRLMYLAKVLIGTSGEKTPQLDSENPPCFKFHEKTGLPLDTYSDHAKNTFYKYNMCETYPEFLLVYRDTTAGPDIRSTQLSVKYAQVSYRTGARFNPEEENTGIIEQEEQVPVTKEIKQSPKKTKKEKLKIKPQDKTGYVNTVFDQNCTNGVDNDDEKENDVNNIQNDENSSCDPKKNDVKEKIVEMTPNVQCVNRMEKPIKMAIHIVHMENTQKMKVVGADNKHSSDNKHGGCNGNNKDGGDKKDAGDNKHGGDNKDGDEAQTNEEEDSVMELICRRKYPNFRRKNKPGKNEENIEMNEISPV